MRPMCGRYSLTTPAEAMRHLFGFAGALPNLPARYNIAPTQLVPVVRLTQERRAGRLG
ncbi:MAG: SOS response-associated peptidase family protein, partial [Alphaproteobacteria bacterium]